MNKLTNLDIEDDSSKSSQSDLFGGNVVDDLPMKKKSKARHTYPSSTDDEFETSDNDYYNIISVGKMVGENPPELDPFTSVDSNGKSNSKCVYSLTENDDVYNNDLLLPDGKVPSGVWCNHPHTGHKVTVELMHNQWIKFGFTIYMIIPSNTRRTLYWDKFIEPYRYGGNPKYGHIPKHIHNFPYRGTITFLKDGKPTVNTNPESDNFGKKQSPRNSYEVLIWCKRKSDSTPFLNNVLF